jgi:CBS domain-containing protein
MSDIDLLRLVQVRPEFTPDTPLAEVVRAMSETEIGAVAVTEGRKLVGIFTERDLMTRLVAPGRALGETSVGEVMSSPAVMVRRDATVEEAAAVMRARHVRHLAVVDQDGDLLGIVSLRHLLYRLLDALEGKVEDQERFIMTDGPGG